MSSFEGVDLSMYFSPDFGFESRNRVAEHEFSEAGIVVRFLTKNSTYVLKSTGETDDFSSNGVSGSIPRILLARFSDQPIFGAGPGSINSEFQANQVWHALAADIEVGSRFIFGDLETGTMGWTSLVKIVQIHFPAKS